ncbi:O-antigen ligase family protein [Halorhodospira halophila]|uniref:O-antigen polymerase n=1 Tax=Halorhodospira halophila (strain DSM 244 / SL1) TaxID=349124 RepID=A1WV63_HALHL|nr:O-antigen ligase family protein [Halorhodospira halophila]ABM61575.1 O-antigen polymerase [Halorhodospira halophila SL1]
MFNTHKAYWRSILPPFEPWANVRLAIADRIGFLALLLIAFTGLWIGDLYRLGLALVVVAFLIAAVDLWPSMKRSALFWVGVAFVLFATIRHWVAVVELGIDMVDSPPKTSQMIRTSPLLVAFAAIWLRGDEQRLVWFLSATLLGAIAWLITSTHWDAFIEMFRNWDWSNARRELYEGSTNRTPFIYLVLSLALITIGTGFVVRCTHVWWRAGLFIASLTMAVGFLSLTLTIETRGAQIAAFVAYGLLAAAMVSKGLRHLGIINRGTRWALTATGGATIIAIGIALWITIGTSSERLHNTMEAGKALAQNPDYLHEPFEAAQEHDAIRAGSVVQRLNLVSLAADAIAERPLVGWGGGTSHKWVREYGRTDFHNWYLDVTVAFGLIGAALYFGGFVYILGSSIRARMIHRLDPHVALFAFSATAAWLTTQLFTTWISAAQGRFTLVFIATLLAFAHTARWLPELRKK